VRFQGPIELSLKIAATLVAIFGVWKYFEDRSEGARNAARAESLGIVRDYSSSSALAARASLVEFWRSQPEFTRFIANADTISSNEYNNFVRVGRLRPRARMIFNHRNPVAIPEGAQATNTVKGQVLSPGDHRGALTVLTWEMGRIDIIMEVSALSSQLALLHEGHLEALFHIFAYLDKKHNARIVFDPSYPEIDMKDFKECDWHHFYGDVKEVVPPNAPEPHGEDADLRMFVDSNHAGDILTHQPCMGYIIA